MNEEQYHAFTSIQFSSVLGPDDIWSPLSHHVDGMHPRAVAEIVRVVRAAKARPRSTPIGLVLSGERGVGKTHMLGWLRQHVQQEGGTFFMPKLIDGKSFWAGAVHGIVNQLLGSDGGQLGRMLGSLAELAGCRNDLWMRLRDSSQLRRHDLDEFVDRVAQVDDQAMPDYQDTLRALVLYQANNRQLREIGHSFLQLEDGTEDADRTTWGFRQRSRVPHLIFGDLTHLFALTGPVVLAIDQIDTVIAQSGHVDEDLLANRLADGLMRMREETTRTVIVAACIPKSWELIETRAVNSASDRFNVLVLSAAMPDSAVAAAIVERHLGGLYEEIGFVPPYPTWPVLPVAFDDPEVADLTPRRLLQQVEKHVRRCLDRGTVSELRQFGTDADDSPMPAAVAPADLMALDDRFERLRAAADVVGSLDPEHEDERMFPLLNAALHCYVHEHSEQGLTIDPPTIVKPALHARLRRTLDEASEDEEHWSFRAIGHTNARAVLTRLRSACLEAGLQTGAAKRHLAVLRNTAFSSGRVTTAALAEFQAARGLALPISEDDLRTFSALEAMLVDPVPGFFGWLTINKPASRSQLLSQFMSDAVADEDAEQLPQGEVGPHSTVAAATAPSPVPVEVPSIFLGRNVETGAEFRVPLTLLRKHTAVCAGSGSGKTVLLRRLVEEAAIHGVSSILIDTNNDLAQLGDRWPRPPDIWDRRDSEREATYFAGTEVVIWTPRREAGRPIALNPLPDFSGIRDDPDEFRTAIDASVAGLIVKTGLSGRRTDKGKAVLTVALAHFAEQGGSDLSDFITLLADLPEGITTLRNAASCAAEMADGLSAAMINDPVFGGAGAHLDPGTLLTPTGRKHARISVISCIGLPTDKQRQTFVSQLQLALFAWIKRHPARDRALCGLLVLDEAQTFVPSRSATASTESTLTLATQARKYGLGMVYATQAPKALHNLVTGNAVTQFIGLLNASAQIQTAMELARAKGGRVDDIARLSAGRFYAATEGTALAKIQVPMCLSHHRDSALTEEEVIRRACREPQ